MDRRTKAISLVLMLLLTISIIFLGSCDDVAIEDYNALENQYKELLATCGDSQNNYQQSVSGAPKPPYVSVSDRTVTIYFKKLDGSLDIWEVPFDALESSIVLGYETRKHSLDHIILTKDGGDSYAATDFRQFIDPNPFVTVIGTLYSESDSEDAFIREVWNAVTQLNTYSEDIEDTPRYPLETLLPGGGDCEDTAILFASMIKAAPVDWDIQLVYMDGDNPTNPQDVNHLMVSIDTDIGRYLIETTSDQNMQPLEYVDGWYLEI